MCLPLEPFSEGSYGKVYNTNEPNRVCKQTAWCDEDGLSNASLRELASLKLLQACPQVPLYHYYGITDSVLDIVMQKYKTNLTMWIAHNAVSVPSIKKILFQILLALRFAQQHQIMHRDLKPANIFLDDIDHVVLGDWGLSRKMGQTDETIISGNVQTVSYRAPELILGTGSYGYEIEVWSLGCIMYELFYQKPLCLSGSQVGQLFKVFQKLGTPESFEGEHFSNLFPRYPPQVIALEDRVAQDLLNKMLRINARDRPTFDECLAHEFFAGLVFPKLRIVSDVSLTKKPLSSMRALHMDDLNSTNDWIFLLMYLVSENRKVPITGRVFYQFTDYENRKRETRPVCMDAYFLACKYYELFVVSRKYDIVYAIACALLATKMQDPFGADVHDFAEISNCSEAKILEAEQVVAHFIHCDMHQVTLFQEVRQLQGERGLPLCKLSAALVYLAQSLPVPTSARSIVDHCDKSSKSSLVDNMFENAVINKALCVMGVLSKPSFIRFGVLEKLNWHFN